MIWCVEDDASILDIEVYTLQSTGFQAQGFADGGAFWSALESAQLFSKGGSRKATPPCLVRARTAGSSWT